MKTVKRVANIIRSHKGLPRAKHSGDKILIELHKHKNDLEAKLDAIAFAEYIIDFEATRWKSILADAEAKQKVAVEKQKILADRLVLLAKATEEKYSERKADMAETVAALTDTLSRVKTTIFTIETDQDLRALSSMLSLDNIGGTSIDIHAESREIRSLLHTADALLELGS